MIYSWKEEQKTPSLLKITSWLEISSHFLKMMILYIGQSLYIPYLPFHQLR